MNNIVENYTQYVIFNQPTALQIGVSSSVQQLVQFNNTINTITNQTQHLFDQSYIGYNLHNFSISTTQLINSTILADIDLVGSSTAVILNSYFDVNINNNLYSPIHQNNYQSYELQNNINTYSVAPYTMRYNIDVQTQIESIFAASAIFMGPVVFSGSSIQSKLRSYSIPRSIKLVINGVSKNFTI